MNNRILAWILAAFFIVLGLYTIKTHGFGKKKLTMKRLVYCVAGLGSLGIGGYCVVVAKKS